MQYKFFPLSRSCCDLPSRHAASDRQARQLRQDLCSSHSLGYTVKREASDLLGKNLLRLVTRTHLEKVTVGRRALALKVTTWNVHQDNKSRYEDKRIISAYKSAAIREQSEQFLLYEHDNFVSFPFSFTYNHISGTPK